MIKERGEDGPGLSLRALHAANIARQAEWCPDQVPDLSFRGNELAGEVGEACNVVKKLERERHGWRGSRATLDDLAQELADVVICADLCAVTAGIDLDAAVVAKFNATSRKQGLSTLLPEAPASTAQPPSSQDGGVVDAAVAWAKAQRAKEEADEACSTTVETAPPHGMEEARAAMSELRRRHDISRDALNAEHKARDYLRRTVEDFLEAAPRPSQREG